MDMFQKIILALFLFIFCGSGVFANQKVEDIFQDINADYKYLWELQLLFDKGIIQPNIHNKFNPYELLTREEFVGILMETNCVQCIKPNANFDLITSFQDRSIYYDVNNDSDYFYCINDADSKNFIQWYQAGTICENWKSKKWEIPFCPYNTIILEEALAIVMRAWNILTQNQANTIIREIQWWKTYPDISEDVKTKNIDNSIYDFYPYFYEAENFTITEFNNLWERIEYSLIEKKWWKYFPKKNINREDFLKIATFALKNSSCIDTSNENISWKINIFEQNCDINNSQCEYEDNYISGTPIDIVGDINTTCLLGFSDNSSYQWVIHNLTNNTEITQVWKYLDNLLLEKLWKYKIDLYITDLCGNKSNITKYISVSWNQDDNFSASINKEYDEDLKVDFSSLVEWNTGEYTYNWDFWDGNTSDKKNPSHTYDKPWIYDVVLVVTDKNGVEKKIPTTVELFDTDFNIAIWTQDVLIWSTEFIQFEWITHSNNPNLIYLWDFWDGNTSNEQNPLHNYTEPWIYTVTLTVTDEDWNTKQVTTQITVGDWGFIINISTQTEVINDWLVATFTPWIEWGVGPFTYVWDLGDGNTSWEEIPTHIYTEPWIYTVELTVTDSQWNTQTTYTQIIVSDSWMNTEIITIPNQENNWEFTFEWVITAGQWPFTYSWNFGDNNSSDEQNPDHIYNESGTYTVTLITTDSNWIQNITQTTVIVVTNWENDFNINVEATPTSWPGPLNSSFEITTQWWTGPFIYKWDFGDGTNGIWKNIDHTFNESWTYIVLVTVIDANGIIKTETIIIQVGNINNDSELDSDKDGILDINDKCPAIPWKTENDWCPIFEKTCNSDSDCPENSTCEIKNNGISKCIPKVIKNNCEYKGTSTVFWNIICNTCPCQNVLDFNASLRWCDVVFPAITSPDGKEVFSKGNYYQIKK